MLTPCFTIRSVLGHLSIATLLSATLVVQAMAQAGKTLTSFENICLLEASRAEARHGIPKGLLQSITRVEAGRKTVTGDFMPWAWTLNDRGEGLFFDDLDAALAYLETAVADPEHSVDVGCMQINTKWHSQGFLELADMLDPTQNADYAAGFLLDLHEAHQSWDDAVKHYHSSAPEKNVGYHRRVLAELERFLEAGMPSPPALAEAPTDAPTDAPASAPADLQQSGGTELALVTRPVTRPMTRPLPSAVPAATPAPVPPAPIPAPVPPAPSAASSAAMDIAPTVSAAPASKAGASAARPFLEEQPNLAPHRARVEHFRRLLSRDPG